MPPAWHAGYFTGADEPYDKLKRALRAEFGEAAWSALDSTIRRVLIGQVGLPMIDERVISPSRK